MMWHTFIELFSIVNLISLLHLGFYVVGANSYDISKFRSAHKKRKSPPAEPYQPLISVVIPAHNEALVIERTLNSVRASSYTNFEIIVVDDGSTDGTIQLVRNYLKHLPTTSVKPYIGSEPNVVRRLVKQGQNFVTRYERSFSTSRRFLRVPNVKIRTVRVMQENAGKAAAMNNAIANYAKGELVMCLDADSIIHPLAIEHAVAYFRDPKIIGVAANVRVMAGKTWLSKLQRFEHMIGYRSKKFYTMTNSEFIIGGVASTYRTDVLKRAGLYDTDTQTEDIGLSMKLIATEGNRGKRIVYASDVVAMTEGVQNFKTLMRQRYRWKLGSLQNMFKYRSMIFNKDSSKYSRMLTRYRLPMAILSEFILMLEPVLLAYVVYISIAHHTLSIILGAYVTVTLYTLWTVWPDEHFTNKQKMQLSVTSLGIYVIFYAMDLVQLAAIFKCIKNFRSISHRNATASTWVSPARSGQAASFSN